jgi:molybdenum cofactor biosynthesis enzyme MoaA
MGLSGCKESSPKYTVELVALHITPVCSHRCGFCYFADDAVKPTHPPLDKLQRVISALGASGVKEVSLLGGDPGAYPNGMKISRKIS